jgi:hypothetical protein
MTNKLLMGGRHMHMEVVLPSAFVERVARAIHAAGHDPRDGEAVSFVFNEALSRLFACQPGPKLDEMVHDGLFAFALEQARRAAQAEDCHDAAPGERLH